jgi:hypothetical protein
MFIIKDVYNDYILNINNLKINYTKSILEYKIKLYDNTKESRISNIDSYNKLINFNFTFLSINPSSYYKNKSLFLPPIGVYQTIINELNIDFNNIKIVNINNSIYSSPIVERIDLNNTFSNIAANVIQESGNDNPLGIQGLSITQSNRNSLTLNTIEVLSQNRLSSKELLNYQSNILYLMINGISPSIY